MNDSFSPACKPFLNFYFFITGSKTHSDIILQDFFSSHTYSFATIFCTPGLFNYLCVSPLWRHSLLDICYSCIPPLPRVQQWLAIVNIFEYPNYFTGSRQLLTWHCWVTLRRVYLFKKQWHAILSIFINLLLRTKLHIQFCAVYASRAIPFGDNRLPPQACAYVCHAALNPWGACVVLVAWLTWSTRPSPFWL